jgi:threonine dehydrogenase-like Zn-dependent dehydrogenase
VKAIVTSKCKVSLEEVAIPTPKEDEVLIRVHYSGICRTDLYVIENKISANYPIIAGHEFSGEIVEGKNYFEKGMLVAVNPIIPCGCCASCAQGHEQRCINSQMLGVDLNGSFAEYVVVPASRVYPVSYTSALKAAYAEPVAACLAVKNTGIGTHEKGLVLGNNRIAKLTELILRELGFRNVDLKPHSVNYYDFAIETMADEAILESALIALVPGGNLIIKSRSERSVPVDFNQLIRKEIKLHAVHYAKFQESIELLEEGLEIDDLIGPQYSLVDYEEAFLHARNSESKKVFFKLI